jgi:hypothetical protein
MQGEKILGPGISGDGGVAGLEVEILQVANGAT